MSFQPPYKYIDADSLASLLKDPKTKEKLVVVDVRDDDFEGGNIKGAINVPSSNFENKVADLVKALQHKDKIVLHCALSQQRGPKAARIYSEAKQADTQKADSALEGNELGISQEIYVLRDGFGGFGPKFKSDLDLVENWDEEAWQYR
ncbi:Rhodanese-like protein [Tilletiaria anomala UBC 951]|uniref:Rhodanese-like protein n=1 Tax=Tilletiaria anomala (strain ATCC 24038 / CBS 436.72 / UBC 951) TaxID=1037660 RepID=A0A066VF82_TILAU|nr:Rhodanese-like protein [Tilletiaria anomala UBC 951]KDN37250.1 Rhodanese-like protein [Tilletiaria anomala UBC 951]